MSIMIDEILESLKEDIIRDVNPILQRAFKECNKAVEAKNRYILTKLGFLPEEMIK